MGTDTDIEKAIADGTAQYMILTKDQAGFLRHLINNELMRCQAKGGWPEAEILAVSILGLLDDPVDQVPISARQLVPPSATSKTD